MAGAYCQFCDRRCFVLRVMPPDARWRPGESVHLATCARGTEYDREKTGYDHATAINPVEGPRDHDYTAAVAAAWAVNTPPGTLATAYGKPTGGQH